MQIRVHRSRKPWTRPGFAVLLAGLLLPAPDPCLAASSTTTTTTIGGVTTTTMFVPADVTGGGQFEGGFPKGSFDAYSFVLEESRVLVAEVSNGFGGCPGDSILELRRPGAPGDCSGEYGDDLPCIAVDDDSGIAVCSKLVHRIAAPGEYEIRVSAYGGKQLSRYFLDVAFLDVQCGDGRVDPTEECDDGNAAGGDCCSAACTRDPEGAACGDGVFCNGPDTCSAAGLCTVHAGDPCAGPDGDGDCSETCDEGQGACAGPDPGGTSCDDGVFCNGADSCASGACSVHAGDPCHPPDGDADCSESCSEAADSCTAADPDGSPCDDGLFCNGADSCSAGECSQGAGDPCAGADGDLDCSESCDEAAGACTGADPDGSACEDGLFCNGTDSCGAGLCNQHAGSMCPGADGDGDCAESCSDLEEGCTGADPAGAPCDDGNFCNGPDHCSGGACSVHEGNPCPGADGDLDCSEACDESADACTGVDADASACDDGLYCNGADSCSGGACSVHAGNPCSGADGDANCAESCNESTDGCTAPDGNGTSCQDGLFCNGADRCSNGNCSIHAGDPCTGPDGDGDCSESCSEAAGACTAADVSGTPCDDGVFCNGADSCAAGACHHGGDPCQGPDGDIDCSESCDEAAGACTAADPGGSTCNDALFCNGADTCASGACTAHTGNPCVGPDGDGNCSESCSEAAENCTAADLDGRPCTDGLFCNGADACVAGLCVQHAGTPCSGGDGDADCTETCDEASDGCTAADPDASACNDGVFCNGADTCSGGACSVHAGNPCGLPDGDGNCSESCSEGTDTCTAADPIGSPCNDGVFCNGADSCVAGACSQHTGDPCTGADGDLDCSETCDDAADACTGNDPNGSACEDGLFCNGADTCNGGLCNQHTGSTCPGADGDGDCSESCSDTEGGCTGADPAGAPCDDGLFCNGEDACAGGLCAPGTASPCADDDDCTIDACNEAGDSCSHLPDPSCATTTTLPATTTTIGVTTTTIDGTTTTLPSPTCGDATGDGQVKSTDALFVLRTAVGDDHCGARRCACDTNGNGVVTSTDALLVLKKAVGQGVALACGC